MDRRIKTILFLLLVLVIFGLVGWFIVWPTLKPLVPASPSAQPPALGTPNAPVQTTPQPSQGNGGSEPSAPAVATFDPSLNSPDAGIIADLERRAGVLAERVESGSSENGFANLDDAQLGVSPTLAQRFRTMKSDLQKAHPAEGPAYVTVARRLVEKGESDVLDGPTFKVTVQLQVQTRNGGATTSAFRQATVTFTQSGEQWLTSAYEAAEFTP